MNKKIKRIIAVALTVSAFCAISPTTNFMTTKVYASTSDTQLKSIYLSDGSINFSKDDTSYDVKVSSSVDEIRITAKPDDSDSTVKIDGSTVDSSDDYRKTVSLDRGSNTIKIEVEDTDSHTRTYTLHVRRGTSSSSSSYDDDVYLDRLSLSDGDIDFDKDDTSYNVRVDSSVDEIKITAEPDDSYDKVRIDGSTVDDDDDYKRTVNLSRGSNKIKVEVEDDDDSDTKRTYTLNISRGYSSDAQNDKYLDELSINDSSINLSDNKTSYDVTAKESVNKITVRAELNDSNDDVFINGTKVYGSDDYEKEVSLDKGRNKIEVKIKDVYGKELKTYTLNVIRGTDTVQESAQTTVKKNQWFYDASVSKTYYFDENGNKAVSWKTISNNWYLFDLSGAMLTGWQQVNGKWYYMYENGKMASNTVVGSWRVDSNGAWIQ